MSSDLLPMESIAEPLHGLLEAGREVVITVNGRPTWVCHRIAESTSNGQPLGFGACKGMLVVNAEDDDHLTDFADYMP